MHGLSRLGSGVNSTPSTSSSSSVSPPSSPRNRRSRNNKNSIITIGGGGGDGGSRSFLRGGGFGEMKLQNLVERLGFAVISTVYRRRGVLLLAPLLYISVMLLYMGTVGFDSVVSRNGGNGDDLTRPGSLYRSPQVFEKLWPFMEAEGNGSSSNLIMNVWTLKPRQSWKPCIHQTASHAELPKSNGFLIIEANGGLNQQRLSICDAVAVAGLLNATLVIPMFHFNSVWRDSSKFGDIFDEDFFIYALRNRVEIVRELPEAVLQHFDHNISNIVNLRLKAWSSPTYYLQKVVPKIVELGAVRVAPFSNRLAHAVPPNIQGLRCLSNFEALRFSESIRMLAAKMVDRMVKNSSKSGGKYISVHLRFEEDMVAFSCCVYDGGEEEKREMDIARERSWRGKFRRRGRIIRPGANRRDGKCPLTPLEVGMMLHGMGFDNNTFIYVAAGKIYQAEKYMAPLKQMFPHLETKDTLASPEELAPFKGHSSRLAALDYTVCLHSEVFVSTQGGNFPHFLVGHRRYLYEGHAKTIKPDKRKLALLFDNPNIRWKDFKRQLQDMLRHSDVKGVETRKPSGSLYTYPMPDCMCKHADGRNDNGNTTGLS
ncbi:O-fucosyltransferase 9 isoform X1 [Coffea eugenioides]|uniref:O-fucosyltransferase 9 isoform X1 n=1 Tax=Coffea eugenioides TaxID=49369 RepID=UPI000F6135DD|nr:O-fucosyltransferase 9 isoform X1 [Coffea eugenioides]